MKGQRALRFHQKYLNLFSEDERRSYGFGMTWGRVINDRIFIFGWTIPLTAEKMLDGFWTKITVALLCFLKCKHFAGLGPEGWSFCQSWKRTNVARKLNNPNSSHLPRLAVICLKLETTICFVTLVQCQDALEMLKDSLYVKKDHTSYWKKRKHE